MSAINGIILAGGLSSRMGSPKALLHYYGIPQYRHLQNLIQPYCSEIYVSCKEEQAGLFEGISCIPDKKEYENAGPIGGIISCMEQLKSSMLIIACDYPLLIAKHLKMLVGGRDKISYGVVFTTPGEMKIEPLVSLIEYNCLTSLKEEFYNGKKSVSALMERENFSRIVPADPSFLQSFDTPEQFQKFSKMSDI